MPSLERTAVLEWIAACDLAPAKTWITPIRSIEESDEAQAVLTDLGEALDKAAATEGWFTNLLDPDAGKHLHGLLGQLGAGRLLRLFRWLSSESGKDGQTALEALLGSKFGQADGLRKTIQSLHRQELLARIFDEARLRALLAASKNLAEGVPT